MSYQLPPELAAHCTLPLDSMPKEVTDTFDRSLAKRHTTDEKIAFINCANIMMAPHTKPLDTVADIFSLPRSVAKYDESGNLTNAEFCMLQQAECYDLIMTIMMAAFEQAAIVRPPHMPKETLDLAAKGFAQLTLQFHFYLSEEFLMEFKEKVDSEEFGHADDIRKLIFESDYVLAINFPNLKNITGHPQMSLNAVRVYPGRGLACESIVSTTYHEFTSMMVKTVVAGVEQMVTKEGADESKLNLLEREQVDFMIPLPGLMREIDEKLGRPGFAKREMSVIPSGLIKSSKDRAEVIEKLVESFRNEDDKVKQPSIREVKVDPNNRSEIMRQESEAFNSTKQGIGGKGTLH